MMKGEVIPPEGLEIGRFPLGTVFGPPHYRFGPWPVKPEGEDDWWYDSLHIRLCTMPDGEMREQSWVRSRGWSEPRPIKDAGDL